MNKTIDEIPFENVSLTMLLMLYSRVMESRSADPIITDPWAKKLLRKLMINYWLPVVKPYRIWAAIN